jgi:type IV secretion system protein VirB10
MANRDLLITQGTMMDCVLETKIITTQPGMTTCHLTRDIYSTSGRVVLLDRGSKVVGFYQGGMQQGQARVFVQWSRVETPQGVLISLDSPATGPLGEAGLGGTVATHFWTRFGGAILISLIGDFGSWASAQGDAGGNTNSIRFDNTSNGAESAAVEALRNSVNIPPTLTKNQGERVAILVARDLDFSDVYALSAQ